MGSSGTRSLPGFETQCSSPGTEENTNNYCIKSIIERILLGVRESECPSRCASSARLWSTGHWPSHLFCHNVETSYCITTHRKLHLSNELANSRDFCSVQQCSWSSHLCTSGDCKSSIRYSLRFKPSADAARHCALRLYLPVVHSRVEKCTTLILQQERLPPHIPRPISCEKKVRWW